MKKSFKNALKLVLFHEGGWADHPRDPGGATMKGVTLAVYRRHFGEGKSKYDLRNISDDELEKIYRLGYWDKCHCDDLPAGVDYIVFDAAVNSGPGRSAKWLQGVVGAKQDGGIGPKTIARVKEQADTIQMANELCDRRLKFLKSLSTWDTFGRGWGHRVEGVRADAKAMYNLKQKTNNPLQTQMTVQQMKNVSQLIKQHKATITNVTVELTTKDGSRVLVFSDGSMKWLRRDEVG